MLEELLQRETTSSIHSLPQRQGDLSAFHPTQRPGELLKGGSFHTVLVDSTVYPTHPIAQRVSRTSQMPGLHPQAKHNFSLHPQPALTKLGAPISH